MIDSAWAYHRMTCYDRFDMSGHYLDWGTQPEVFKTYPDLEMVSLPKDIAWPEENLSDLVGPGLEPDPDAPMNLDRLARIVVLTHSLTAKTRHGQTHFYFRSPASAGALYPYELYVAALNIAVLESGLYHHNVLDHSLTRLRSGNGLSDVAKGVRLGRDEPPVAVFFLTSIFFRSSWKYRDRAYRYHLLDTGHLAENLALALRSDRLRFSFLYDFDDVCINKLLGLDTEKEVCLAVVPVWGKVGEQWSEESLHEPKVDLTRFSRVASKEIDYPAIREAHQATSKVIRASFETPPMASCLGVPLQEERVIPDFDRWPEVTNYAEAVMSRRSMRNFVRNELRADCMAALLKMLCSKSLSRADEAPTGNAGLSVGFLAGRVEGMEPGFYIVNREAESVSLASQGHLTDEMAYACLGQSWLANCAVHFLFLSNLEVLERAWGPRGYRHVMLTAGRLGQRIYVAATSMRLGCCGIGAYFDNEAQKILGLNAQSNLLYLVACGPVRKYATR